MKTDTQLDVFLHSDASKAFAYRIAAVTVRHDPYFPEAERADRAAYYEAQADLLEGRRHE